MKVQLNEKMDFIKALNSEGSLIGNATGDLEVFEKYAVLKVGSFKQTMSLKKAKKILDANNVSRETKPNKSQFEDVETESNFERINELNKKSKQELYEIALETYRSDQIDKRWGKPKLIDSILKAEE